MKKTELITAEESKEVVVDNAAPILSIIQQVASDPNSDVDKMERLLKMHNDMVDRDALQAYMVSMKECQSEMPIVARDTENKQTNSSYAKYESIITKTLPIYTGCGFSISFGTDISPIQGYVRITAELMHSGGHSKDYFVDLPPDGAGIKGTVNKTGVHAAGSTFSYGKRYLFCMIFNIAIADEDNDGNGNDPIDYPAVLARLLNHNIAVRDNIESIVYIKAELAADRYDGAVEAMRELHEETRIALGLAPTKGGIWTIEEKRKFQSDEYAEARTAYFNNP